MSYPEHWTSLSRDLSDATRDDYDVIVIGSGYGGGVAASRLARAHDKGKKLHVAVLERGREIAPGKYPNDLQSVQADTQVTFSDTGKTLIGGKERHGCTDALYDLRIHKDVSVLIGCGLGGTSLINANVAIKPDPRIYDDWPEVFRNGEVLDEYFDMAKAMLGSNPYPRDDLYKLKAMEKVAVGLKAQESFLRPDINVTFEDRRNQVDIFQPACTGCGDCCTGCNYGAKNTVLMNYLPDAKANGAEILTHAEVVAIEALPSKSDRRWKIEARDPNTHKTKVLVADYVVLAAGTLGTNEILLNSRKRGLKLSKRLGKGFSGNGDVWAFAYNANIPQDDEGNRAPTYSFGAGARAVSAGDIDDGEAPYRPGPTITGAIHLADPHELENGMLLEEGVLPGAFAPILGAAFPMLQVLKGDPFRFNDATVRADDARSLSEQIAANPMDIGATVYSGPLSRTMMYLVMSHDSSAGEMAIENGRVTVNWDRGGSDPAIIKDEITIKRACDSIQAEYLANPIWMDEFGNRLLAVHPLGGCGLGEDGETGVINPRCQVFRDKTSVHEGLYVCDGAAMPKAVGVNPHLTITALAEYAMQSLADSEDWVIDRTPRSLVPDDSFDPALLDVEAIFAGLLDGVRNVKTAIDNQMWEMARFLLSGFWRQITGNVIAKKYKLPDLETFLEVICSDEALAAGTGDIFGQLLEILAPIEPLIAEKDYAAIVAHLEDALGDFSPPANLPESMVGHVSSTGLRDNSADAADDPFALAEVKASNHCSLTGNIRSNSTRIVLEPHRQAGDEQPYIEDGVFEYDGRSFDIRNGKFEFMKPVSDEIEHWKIAYSGDLVEQGATFKKDADLTFHGFKTLQRREGANFWADISDLRVEIRDSDGPVARGMIRVTFEEAIRQAARVSVLYDGLEDDFNAAYAKIAKACTGDISPLANLLRSKKNRAQIMKAVFHVIRSLPTKQDPVKKVEDLYMAKLLGRMGSLIIRTYGGITAYVSNYPYHETPEHLELAKGLPKPEVYFPETEPGVYCKLTRFNGKKTAAHRKRDPIMLAGGFGTRASSLGTPTVERNIVQDLYDAGYDVWLFDYRGSGDIKASLAPFNIDDVAEKDWPAAISLVLRLTNAKKVKALVHCVGSMSLFMAILRGETRVRNVLASQLGPHPITNWFKFMQGDSGLADLIAHGVPDHLLPIVDLLTDDQNIKAALQNGFPTFDARSPSGDAMPEGTDTFVDVMTWTTPNFMPVQCYSPTCHRINFFFGPTFLHENLNQETHNAIRHFFGPLSTIPMLHLSKMFNACEAISDDGAFRYTEHGQAFEDIPVHFIHGAQNQEILPEATLRTLSWLKKSNKGKERQFSRHVFQGYGHMDTFVGRNAHKDIFPHILEILDKLDDTST